MHLAGDFFQALSEKYPQINVDKIKEAYFFAKEAHKGQFRTGGEEYVSHPVEVATILLDLDCDEAMLIVAFLHDTVEDTSVTQEDIKNKFGDEVANLVAGLTKISKVEAIGLERQVHSIRKMFIAMAEDIRVIFIKLADRLHNMRTIDHCPPDKKLRIARETLDIYAPIATRLGIYHIKNQLEELCFKILFPKDYVNIEKKLSIYNKKQEKIAETATYELRQEMKKNNVPIVQITYRVKEKYSIFQKMQKRKEDNLDNIYDIFALRVITDTIENCYRILGIIHKNWTPLPNRIKDYFAVPKSNGYKSLHTTILGLGKSRQGYKPIEIQIRTLDAHEEAEKGLAAHWAYKEGLKSRNKQWVQSLMFLAQDLQDSSSEFIQHIKDDNLYRRIYVLTPKGDIKDLPYGSTPIDFAYSIHSDIGQHTASAKANGKIVTLDYVLKDGDIIEIRTDKNRSPNPAWINIVRTNQAKSSIKFWLKKQSQEKLFRIGKEEFNQFLKKLGEKPLDTNLSLLKSYKEKELSFKERENIITQIGEGAQKVSDIIKNIFYTEKNKLQIGEEKKIMPSKATTSDKILVMGDSNFKTRISACCNPDQHDKITGFITRGGYVSIHKMGCSFVEKATEDRFVECHWENEELPFEVEFLLNNKNIVGVASNVLSFLSSHSINILTLNLATSKARNMGTMQMLVEIKDLDRLTWIADDLKRIEGVKSVDYKVKN